MKQTATWILIILRLLSALPFAVFYSSLQLYLLKTGFSQNIATSIVGSTLALSFGLALLGGYCANKHISHKKLFLVCLILQTIGCFTFSTTNHSYILWLSCFYLAGSAGITISLNMLITQQYQQYDNNREKAFFWLYMSLNLGYFVGYSISGHYGNLDNYHLIPWVVTTFSTIAVLLIFSNWQNLQPYKQPINTNILKLSLGFIILLLISRLLLYFTHLTNDLIILTWIISSATMLILLNKKYEKQRKETTIFYVLLISTLIFWSLFFLAPMALIVFINNQVNLQFHEVSIAPQWIQSINSFIIIIGSALLALKTRKNKFSSGEIMKYFYFGLLLLGLGLLLLFIATTEVHTQKINISWVIISYTLQSIGELCIGPIGFSLIGRFIPKPEQSKMMSIWITLLGVASAIASKLSSFAPSSPQTTVNSYNSFFLSISIISIIAAISIYQIRKKLCR